MLSEARRELLNRRLRGELVPLRRWGPRPDGPAPLSFAQQRLWFLDQMEPGSAEYNVPLPMPWSGELDVAALGAALSRVVERHEVLRTRLVTGEDGVPRQMIDPPGPVPLPVADVSGCDSPLDEAHRLIGEDLAMPFALARGPLIRALLIRVGTDEHVLALALHHVVFDEWSGRILRRELSVLYEAFRAGEPDPLPPLAVQYADFAVWQQEHLTRDVLDRQLAYWRDQLAELPLLELSADRPRPPVRSAAGAVMWFAVPAEVAEGLRQVGRECGATMFMTLLAGFSVLLGRYCDTSDVVVGTPVANRNQAEIEDLIGFFVNMLVMRADLSGDPTFAELLERVRQTTLAAYAHQDLPFEQLVDALMVERDRSRAPLFQVMFNYATSGSGEEHSDPREEPAPSGRELPVRFDLSVTLGAARDGGLIGRVEYSTVLFDAATMERMAGHLAVLLQAIAADRNQPVSRLPVLTDVERHELVAGWNDIETPVQRAGRVDELVGARADESPDVVAVTSDGRSLTYAGLVGRRVFVLGRDLGLAPTGVAGELFVSGAGVARGCAGQPALTAERFVANPFAGDGSRMYRSGDRARWRAGGVLEFLGRRDHQLPVPDSVHPDPEGFVSPSGVTEELLAGVWVQVLGVDRVGALDNFFELGGRSLLATQIISRVRGMFGAEVPVAALFDQPTVRGMAAVIESAAGAVAPPVQPAGRDQVLPLSFAQQRLWFLDQLEPGSAEYNLPVRVRWRGGLDVAALGAALSRLVERHEVLRTRLVAGADGVPRQVIDPPSPVPLPVVDVSKHIDPAAAARLLARPGTSMPFDLAGGPLIRATVFRLGADEHVLALAVHHVVFDEWSGQIFRRELSALYEAFLEERLDPLPPLAVQYADFAVWQREHLAGEILDRQMEYWRQQLAGLPVLDLPADRPRPPVRSTAGALGSFTVAAGTTQRLRELSRAGGVTMFMTLLAAFVVLLGRYCDTDDIVVGTPVANRNRAETEDLIGFFVNTLVVRADLSGDPTFTDLLSRVRQTTLAAYAHQDLPFEQLVDTLAIERDRSRTPVFQVLFNYFDRSDRQVRPGGAGARQDADVVAKFDLRMILADDGAELAGEIEYSTALFDATTVERIAGHLLTVLEGMATDAGRPVSGMPVLTDGERRDLVNGRNDTGMPLPAVAGVHDLIAGQADIRPDTVAVVAGERWLSYRGLMDRTNRLACYLRGAGVGAETVVALCLPGGADLAVAIMAVWRAGGAYLPLDLTYPAERLAFILADSRATVLVGNSSALEDLPVGRLRTVALDDPMVMGALAALRPDSSGVAIHPGQLAYVMYTSGSTGQPKGVHVPHGGLVNYVSSVVDRVGWGTPGGRYCLLQSAVTDFGNTVIFGSLATGGVLHVLDSAAAIDVGAVASYVAAYGTDYVKVVPSHFMALGGDRGDLANLVPARGLVLGGEAAPVDWLRELLAAAGERWVVNHYGPTETTIGVVTTRLTVDLLADGRVPIGSPVANTTVFVLDRFLNPVPVGVAGELFIGGMQVVRGYGGRPALTAERFITDPFAADGSRMYRTGDRVRWRADGRLEFIGRADDQLKVRGFRVEPGEVQAVLAAHPMVRTAAVAAFKDDASRLAAYLVPADLTAGLPPVSELRDHLRSSLPEFMVPAVFVELAELPLTPNGKLDRSALPLPDATRPDIDAFEAPAGVTEELLAGIWAQVLGVDRVGANDNFFELGGHSLLATQVVSRVREVFGAEVVLSALFDQPTVRGLAPLIDGAADGVVLPPVQPVGRGRALPLSFAQQRLWFLAQLEPGSAEYNVPMPIRLGGDLDVAALGAALTGVVARHEVLRTRLVGDADGVAHQVIDPPGPFPLPVVDVSGRADPAKAARLLVGRDAVAPFDLAGGPLIRGVLIRVAADEHVLALSVHHVVSDEWSGRIIHGELAALYEAFRAGEPDPLPPLAVQYADFAVWQREHLAGEVLEGQLAYWRDQLAGLPVLELPADRPRSPVRSVHGAMAQFTIPAETVAALRELARAGGATMFMTLFAAFAVLLGRYCDTEDVVVGTPVANRNRVEIEDLIGFFINMLVLRTDLSGDPAFTELLGRVRQTALAAHAHQDVPFEHLVDALVTDRDQSRSPLFQVLFNYFADSGQHDAGQHDAGQDIQAGVVARVDLRLILADSGGGLFGALEYSTALFDAVTVERMAGHLVAVLEAVAAGAGRPLSRLAVMTAAERHRLVHEWNATNTPVPPAGGAHELIAARAAECPDAVAVVSDGRSLTYAALMERADRLAHYLRGVGVGAETVVGLCLPRGVEMVVAILATWRAGGAYLPLDPEYPAERLAFMLADSGTLVVVGTTALIGNLPVGRVHTIALDDPVVTMAREMVAPTRLPADRPDQLAYVMYTSGTTGVPKGVHVPHRGLVNLATAQGRVFGLGRGDVVVQFASLSFDAAVWELVMALVAGARLVVATSQERAEPAVFAAMARRDGVGVATVPPSLLNVLRPDDLFAVDVLVAAGEALDERLAGMWGRGRRLFNAYGPTETTVCASIALVDPNGAGVPPIGRPIGNTSVYVLDRSLNPVPVGVVGELFIGGAQIARGYRGRPGLTAERFIADPFAGDGSRLYRTGDRVRWRADGQLEFVGRADDQVKVRGFRIEPAEVEAVLSAHPGIQTAVVTVFGEEADRRLAAYVVPADPAEGIPPVGELRAYSAERLPKFMVPAVYTELAALPLTRNGKINRAALPAPDGARPGGYVAPDNATEELLAEIWAQLLGLDRVGANDSFFDLGGHSLLATQAVSRIREMFGAEVPLSALFDRPTVRGLAPLVEGAPDGVVPPPVRPVGRDRELPLSFAQQRLWFLDQLEPGSAEYNLPMPIRLGGNLDVAALGAALARVVARHEVLRTRLVAGADGVAHQVIDPPFLFSLPVVDVSADSDPVALARVLVGRDARAPFDLAAGPLIRAVLVRLGAERHVLALSMHHVIGDDWSGRIFHRELAVLYEAFRAVDPDPLPPLAVQYADFALWQREWLTGEVLEIQLGYWRRQLAELPVLELPTDRPRPPVRSAEGSVVPFVVPAATTEGLRALARECGVTMFMTLLAAYVLVLGRYCGTDDVVVGTPVANRNRAETEDLIGLFINTLVMRTDLSGDPAFAELLGRVREMALAAYAHQDLPFERLVDVLVTERDRSRSPLFQVFFNYNTREMRAGDNLPAKPSALSLGAVAADVVAKFDLRLIFTDDGAGLTGSIMYSTALFDAVTVERLAGRLLTVLAAAVADAGMPVSQLPVLTSAERDQLLVTWSGAAAPAPAGGAVHELIAERAEVWPDAVAVVSGGRVLSYRGLMARANPLAHYLRGAGVRVETVVGLCLPRGADMIAAIIAVWQAGGAYLPLDPAYPAERLAFMLADSRAMVVVGTADVVEELPAGRLRTIALDDPAVIGGQSASPSSSPDVAAEPGRLAYVMYTSGSTGLPKGVLVTHRGLANYTSSVVERLGWGEPGNRYALLQSPVTDFGNTVILTSLLTGGALHVLDPEIVVDGGAVAGYLTGHGIDYLKMVPSHLAALGGDGALARLTPAKGLVLGGEAAPVGWARELVSAAAGRRVVNHYGPTETTIGVATVDLTPELLDGGRVPIGSPLANTTVFVLDRSMNPVPAGAAGELFVGGVQVARGYGGRPALTAERFVADSFAADGSRLYRTGDRVRWRADGRLEFLGRIDDQVKVRGFRIEPGEIQVVLVAHPGVRAAVVIASGDETDRRLVAYVVPADPGADLPSVGELRNHLLRSVPEFMVPAVFVELTNLPLTANGKVDRAALPAYDAVRLDLDGFVAPSGEEEESLAEIWRQVLGVERIGARDNFFELGGHSLLATQVVSRIRDVFGVELPLAALFDQPTIAETAVTITGAMPDIDGDYEEFEI